MIGIKTSDDVYFLADSLFSLETISKYHLFFMYDVRAFIDTLDFLSTLNGKMYIPSHTSSTNDISDLILLNRNKVNEVINVVYEACEKDMTFEKILKYIFDRYNLVLDANQYVLVGSSIKSYLSYLYDENKVRYYFKDNEMIWSVVE